MRIILRNLSVVGVIASASLTGCATIVTGGKQAVIFDSSPQGANIEVQGLVLGQTPATVTLSRKDDFPVQIKKDGYKSVSVVPSKTGEPLLLGNIITGGIIGTTIDAASGSIHKFSPNSYFVTLEPLQAEYARTIGGVYLDAEDVARIKQFILISYEPLSKNIAEGTGSHLHTLFSLLKIDTSSQASALEKLRALLTLHDDIVSFADGVMRQFSSKKELPKEVPAINKIPTATDKKVSEENVNSNEDLIFGKRKKH